MVRAASEARFREGSARVPRRFRERSAWGCGKVPQKLCEGSGAVWGGSEVTVKPYRKVLQGSARVEKLRRVLLGISPERISFRGSFGRKNWFCIDNTIFLVQG